MAQDEWQENAELSKHLSSPELHDWTQGANFYEEKVSAYTLPDPLVCEDGTPVTDASQWHTKRRPEILECFRENFYGRVPIDRPEGMRFELFDHEPNALNGTAVRKQVRIHFTAAEDSRWMDLLLYTPTSSEGPVPVFLGLNFWGNHAVYDDPGIRLGRVWEKDVSTEPRFADEETRGSNAEAWQLEYLLSNGYGLATIHADDLDPNFHDAFQNGVHGALDSTRGDDSWGSLAALSWGLSRAMDYLEIEDAVDSERVCGFGHSRQGKVALWAAVCDPRFAMVIANNSGCGGAALSRRNYGETLKTLDRAFPHWMCKNLHDQLVNGQIPPIDQHMLIALMAPRPVYVASADEDLWADPRGEFLGCMHAGVVYELLGHSGLEVDRMPLLHQPIHTGRIGYHIRAGGHGVSAYDWRTYIEFARSQGVQIEVIGDYKEARA